MSETRNSEAQRKLDELAGKVKVEAEAKKGAVVEAAQQLKDQVNAVSHDVKERTQAVVEGGKERLTSSLDGIASTLQKTTEELQSNELGQFAPYSERLQNWTRGISDYLKTAKASDLLHDAETLARRQPALFIGGAFAVGLIAARFLKSSATPRYEHGYEPRQTYGEGYEQ
jgi:hypothetical protein